MDVQPAIGPETILAFVVADAAHAISARSGEFEPQRVNRAKAGAAAILAFMPSDAVEAMLASHCVMFHEMIVDSVSDTLRGEVDTARRGTRNVIVAMDKSFGANFDRLVRYRNNQAEDAPEARSDEPLGETDIAGRALRHRRDAETRTRPDFQTQPDLQTATPTPSGRKTASATQAGPTVGPSAGTAAAGVAHSVAVAPEAIAGPGPIARRPDPRPLGEADLNAAAGWDEEPGDASIAGFNRQASGYRPPHQLHRSGPVLNRQARRHPNP